MDGSCYGIGDAEGLVFSVPVITRRGKQTGCNAAIVWFGEYTERRMAALALQGGVYYSGLSKSSITTVSPLWYCRVVLCTFGTACSCS